MVMFFGCLCVATTLFAATANGVEYGYDGNNGPEHWGDMKKEWRECKLGKSQSPIALHTRKALQSPNIGPLDPQCNKASNYCSLFSTRYAFKVFVAGAHCSLETSSNNYTLTDFHFHMPSEHTINKRRFPMEMHMVYKNGVNGGIAVVAKMFQHGQSDAMIAQVLSLRRGGEYIDLMSKVKLSGIGFYRYFGSLTTPPCTEGVQWTIAKEISEASKKQMEEIWLMLNGSNARPAQELNSRRILKYHV